MKSSALCIGQEGCKNSDACDWKALWSKNKRRKLQNQDGAVKLKQKKSEFMPDAISCHT